MIQVTSNFSGVLKRRDLLWTRNLYFKYFIYKYKKACNLGKIYLLPKIHKGLSVVSGSPVISNWEAPTENVSEFLNYYLKPVMQNGNINKRNTRKRCDICSKLTTKTWEQRQWRLSSVFITDLEHILHFLLVVLLLTLKK